MIGCPTPDARWRAGVAVVALWLLPTFAAGQTAPSAAHPALSHRAALAAAYDAILNADFDRVPTVMAPACAEVPTWCDVMDAAAIWWQIALEPESRRHDAGFLLAVERAIAAAEIWTRGQPERAEAWFALGAAYGARAQWRVERRQRLAAARDGKRIRSSLERALALDPRLQDAHFGIGMYRYYAAVAPVGLRLFRWLLLLPGGNRDAGLQQMIDAYERGDIISGEAAYQLHLAYLWYEDRAAEALALIRELQQRYPRNPLFVLIEANILDVYFHDADASETVLEVLIARAESADVNAPALALRRARARLLELRTRTPR